MGKIKLSILICTTSARSEVIKPLLANICSQIGMSSIDMECRPSNNKDLVIATEYIDGVSGVEILINDNETDNVGKKRNTLLNAAWGEYVIWCDSDDEISPNYVSLILKAIESNPDCVAINGIITTNGKDERKWFISRQYKCWYTGRDGVYYRTPNHISPVRRELALKAGFPEISHGEDAEYSRRLLPFLKTETYIEQPIYHYKFRNDKDK